MMKISLNILNKTIFLIKNPRLLLNSLAQRFLNFLFWLIVLFFLLISTFIWIRFLTSIGLLVGQHNVYPQKFAWDDSVSCILPFEDCTLDNIDTMHIGFDDFMEQNKNNPNANFVSLSFLFDNAAGGPNTGMSFPGTDPPQPPLLLKLSIHCYKSDIVGDLNESSLRDGLKKPLRHKKAFDSSSILGHRYPKPNGLLVILTRDRPTYDIFNSALYDSSAELQRTCTFPTPLATATPEFFPVTFDKEDLNIITPETAENFYGKFTTEYSKPMWHLASPEMHPTEAPSEYIVATRRPQPSN